MLSKVMENISGVDLVIKVLQYEASHLGQHSHPLRWRSELDCALHMAHLDLS